MADFSEPESEAEAALDQANPAAVSLALGARGGKGWETDARAFLRKQARLLDLQIENLNEERHLQLAHLKVRRWKDRLSMALLALGIFAGLAVVAGFGAMAWDAHEDHGLVVEAFSVPPDLAARGLTGQAVAAQLQDWLAATKREVDSGTARAGDSYRHDWGSDIKVEIPETGVSIGEIQKLLREELGHETRISGQMYRTASGLSASVRIGEQASARAAGGDGDIEAMVAKLGEGVFAATQPYRYGVYLKQHGRTDEALAVFGRMAAVGEPGDRAWGEAGLAAMMADVAVSQQHVRRAVALDPNLPLGWQNLASGAVGLGLDEEGLRGVRRAIQLLDGPEASSVNPVALPIMRLTDEALLAGELGDSQTAARLNEQQIALPAYYRSDLSSEELEAEALALNYDTARARAIAGAIGPDTAALARRAPYFSGAVLAYALIDTAREDWPAAAKSWGDVQALTTADPHLGIYPPAQVWPNLAEAEVRSGDVAAGLALIARMPADCYPCWRAKGRIAAFRRDWAGADAAFAEAVRQAPSVPLAYSEWGAARLAKGDVAGAIAKFKLAHAKGPHFPDPLELWGEALMRQGDVAGAEARYAEAGKCAPRWGRLRLRWGDALAKLGKAGAARAQWTAAAGLDLNAPDRADLTAKNRP